MSRTVLVTGGTGMVGAVVVRHLARAGWRVRAASRTPVLSAGVAIEHAPLGDLSGAVDWRPLVEGADAIVHLAALAHTNGDRDDDYRRINTEATRTLAIAAVAARVQRLVFVSSVRAQSGPGAASVLTERNTPKPTDAYGRSKLDAERLIAAALATSATDWVVLRPTLVFGPGAKGNMALIEKLARLPIPLGLAGLAGRRSLVGSDALASAIAHALAAPACRRGTFLIAERGPLTVSEIIVALRAGLGRGPGVFSSPAALITTPLRLLGQGRHVERLTRDIVVDAAAFEATGWSSGRTAAEGLAGHMRTSLPMVAL